jgi:hypothetical protein
MRTYINKLATISLAVAAFVVACETTPTGPNDLGGDTDLELTRVGGQFQAFISAGSYNPAFDRLRDSVVITKSDNGIVTTHVLAKFDSVFFEALDSSLGTSSLPDIYKFAILDTYLLKFGATLDTTDKTNIILNFDVKMKVTSEGIQEFVISKGDMSRPYTIVKYGAAVGDKYEFTNAAGNPVTRTVVYKSTTDDYSIGFFLIKIIQVEQVSDDPLMEKVTFYANHKFGLVGVVLKTKTGKELKLGVVPPNM